MSQYDDLESVPPNLPRPGAIPTQGKSLGKLAQSARGSELKSARNILFVVAGITIINGALLYGTIEGQIDADIAKQLQNQPGGVIDPAIRQQLITFGKIVAGAFFVLAAIYIVFGLVIQKYPVPISIMSLTLYVGVIAILALADWHTLAYGWFVKIIVIVALSKAIQAAFAYKKEESMARSFKPRFGGGADF